MPASLRLTVLLLMAALWAAASASAVEPRGAAAALEEALAGIPAGAVPSGVLYDRVLPLSRIERFDGTSNAPETDLGDWRQAEDELRRATLGAPFLPRLADLPSGRIEDGEDQIPLAILDVRYDRLRSDALETGAIVTAGGTLRLGRGEAFVAGRAELAAPLRPFTHRGTTVRFRLDPSLFLSNDPAPLARLSIDFDDGRGPLDVDPSGDARVHYATTGRKSLRVRAILADGRSFEARTSFLVRDLRTPSPNDTIHVTATIPYLGQYGTGDAYVYLAEGHDTITNPVVVIEGFDIDNTMHWDELYALLNRQNLLETLRGEGFDAVVLDFTDAVDYIQRNAFVAEALLEQVASSLLPQETMVVVGASMGGLVGRYALAWMETHGIPHRTRTFLSFDSPQAGADVPLGIQYWLDFFANDSAEAAALLAALDTPGARQMLVYHHTSPPGGTGESDPLRTELLADLQAAGGYPVQLRKAAVANGSGSREDQGFAPAQQILLWEYSSWLVDVTGDVWAVPDGSAATIFRGEIDVILLPPDETTVTVSGTRPFDGAPGGWRDSMAQMDAVEACLSLIHISEPTRQRCV
ncbi:MAG: hypothetical protein QUU85_06485, partial [Candidatus Eisenbacteria bacterium]|nr:hypothetical protein [Candidatus Eisenbacteria bacterium]